MQRGGFFGWLSNLGSGLLRRAQSVGQAFETLFSTSQNIAGVAPDAQGLRSALEGEQLRLQQMQQPDAQAVSGWIQDQTGPPPDSVFMPTPHNQIRPVGEMRQPYKASWHMVTRDANGEITKEKWVSTWYDHNPTPSELTKDIDTYWSTAGAVYGYDMEPAEYEISEDMEHPDWRA